MTTENQNQRATHQTPTRELRIEGERTASMFALATQVSKLDAQLRNLATVPTVEARRTYRDATEKFQTLIGAFEDGLLEILRAAQVQGRRGRQERNRPARPINEGQQQPAGNAGQTKKPGKTATAAPSKPQQEKNNGTQQQPAKPKQPAKEQKPTGKAQQAAQKPAQGPAQQPPATGNADTPAIEPQAETAPAAVAEAATSVSGQPAVVL